MGEKHSTTDPQEVLRQADINAGIPPSEAKIEAPADAMDLQHRIAVADQSPVEGVEELVKAQEGQDEGVEDMGSGPYEGRSLAQLQALAASKDMSTSGAKDELIERLRG